MTRASRKRSNRLYELANKKGAYTRINDDLGYQSLESPPIHLEQLDQKFEHLLGCLQWRDFGGSSLKHREHVNIKELEALKHKLRRLVNQEGRLGRRRIVVIDSRGVLGAWCQGRSSPRRRNQSLRGALGWMVLGSLKLLPVWVCSAANVADDPSRFVPLRQPFSIPDWGKEWFDRSQADVTGKNSLNFDTGDDDITQDKFVDLITEPIVYNFIGPAESSDRASEVALAGGPLRVDPAALVSGCALAG